MSTTKTTCLSYDPTQGTYQFQYEEPGQAADIRQSSELQIEEIGQRAVTQLSKYELSIWCIHHRHHKGFGVNLVGKWMEL